MHNASVVVLGSTQSNDKDVSCFNSNPATFLAGLAVRQSSTEGELSLTAGVMAGISLGKSLSDHSKTSVLRAGLRVPVLLSQAPARGVITISSYANLVAGTPDTITVGATAFTASGSPVTPTQATFQAASSNNATAISLAAQINAHATAGALVEATVDSVDNTKVNITSKLNTTAPNSIALAYADLGTDTIGASVSDDFLSGGADAADYVVIGAKVYFSDVTGKADDPNSDSTITDAVYVSGVLTGLDESGAEVACALVDMPGGL